VVKPKPVPPKPKPKPEPVIQAPAPEPVIEEKKDDSLVPIIIFAVIVICLISMAIGIYC
jgi:hypothetical protein